MLTMTMRLMVLMAFPLSKNSDQLVEKPSRDDNNDYDNDYDDDIDDFDDNYDLPMVQA